jgi:hypothetical protein
MKAIGHGKLRHCFFGTYIAVIALGFDTEYQANQVLPKLGPGWRLGERSKKALVWEGNSQELDVVKDVLEGFGADRDKIASLAKSIDYGEDFSIQVEIVPEEQMGLPIT